MANKLAGFKYKGKKVWKTARGSLFTITKSGNKSYLPKAFTEGYKLGMKHKKRKR